jgi:hypothetical protein
MSLRRKNLIVDEVRLRTLATKLQTSESAAVRRAVELALAGEEVGEALKRLGARGTLADAYRRGPKR